MFKLLQIESGYSTTNFCVWSNNGYIFEVYSDLPKNDTLALAKSTKVL